MPFKKGQINNPKGKLAGTRDAINKLFLRDTIATWRKHGTDALDKMATERPSDFVRVVAALQPKEANVSVNATIEQIQSLTEEQLIERIRRLDAEAGALAVDGGESSAETHH
jgi:hypothetical protein